MSTYLTTKELAELLRIKERKVYDLVASGEVPCTRATGKLLFPRAEIDKWLARNQSSRNPSTTAAQVILGSHDPLLEWALRVSQCGIASYFDSSMDGLERFDRSEGIATGMHLYDVETAGWNTHWVESRFSQADVVLVEWAKRSRGIIVQADNIADYSSLSDLAGKQLVPRQPEAGSQVVLNALLNQQGINTSNIHLNRVARSEVDAVSEVVEGRADATFGLATLASHYRLGFLPIIEERYDILVNRRDWFEPGWQGFIAFCQSAEFKEHAAELAGYNIDEQFSVRYNSAG